MSSACGGPIAKFIGRKASIWLASLLCVISNIIMQSTTGIGALYFARLLNGIANGLYLTFAQLYLNECAPARYRGLVIGLFQSWTSIGTLVGTVVDNFTVKIGGRSSYIVPLGIIYIVPGLMSIGLFFIPESPRWYLLRNETEKARKALYWLRPYPDLVDQEVHEISSAIEAERALAKSADMMDMFRNPVDRRRTLLSCGAISLQAASGAMYMISYGTYFFEMAHVGSAFENACILVAVGVVAILINSAIITRWGRRRVFLTVGMTICGITQLIVAVVYQQKGPSTSTGKVSPLNPHRHENRVRKSKWLTLIPQNRLSWGSQSSTSWATMAWWRPTPGSAAPNSHLRDSEAIPLDWQRRLVSSVPGSRLSALRTSSTQIPSTGVRNTVTSGFPPA